MRKTEEVYQDLKTHLGDTEYISLVLTTIKDLNTISHGTHSLLHLAVEERSTSFGRRNSD